MEGGSLGGLVEEDAKKGLLLLSYVGRLLMSYSWLRKCLLEFHKVYTIYGGPQQEGFRPRV